jgi:glutathione S-transferase
MSKLTLHGSSASTYVRTVRLVLEEKGLAYDLLDVNFVTEEHKTEEYKTLHPYSKMPVFKDGDFSVYETIAICNYIERAHPDTKSLRPVGIQDQANMERLIHSFSSYMFSPMIGQVVWQRVVEPLKGNTPDESIVNDALPEVKRILSLLNEELAGNTYFVNNELSLFDLFLTPAVNYLMMVEEMQQFIGSLPALKAWWDNISASESFKATA